MKGRLYHADAARRAEIRRGLIAALEHQADIAFAYLHGSLLDLDIGAFHDVDVAVWLDPLPAATERLRRQLELMGALSKHLALEVDVQVLNEASLTFRFAAMHGDAIVCRDEELLSNILEETMTVDDCGLLTADC